MARIDWSKIKPEVGNVIVTPTEPGKVLVSLGRKPTRLRPEGVKHLGVLDEAEARKVWAALDGQFQFSKNVKRVRAA
jgi:hypothetical protein